MFKVQNTKPLLLISANKIHISEATHLALNVLGGYKAEFRAEIDIKVTYKTLNIIT